MKNIKARLQTLTVALLALSVTKLNAGDFQNKPIELRIDVALDRVSTFTDTIARSASMAYPVGTSVNPAADDFLRDPPFDFGALATGSTNFIPFNAGGWVSGVSTTGLYRLVDSGTISGTYARTDSHNVTSRQNTDFKFGSNQLTLGYSQKLFEKFALGISTRFTEGNLAKDDHIFGSARDIDNNFLAGDFNVGIMLPLSQTLLLGALGGAGWSASNINAKLRFPAPPFGPGPLTIKQKVTTRTSTVRAGLGWRPRNDVGIYADAQYLHFDNKMGHIDVGRAQIGADFFPLPFLVLRAGATVDTEPQASFSAGIGYYLIKNVPLEVAYSYNAFPEVRREFGRANLISLSLAVVF